MFSIALTTINSIISLLLNGHLQINQTTLLSPYIAAHSVTTSHNQHTHIHTPIDWAPKGEFRKLMSLYRSVAIAVRWLPWWLSPPWLCINVMVSWCVCGCASDRLCIDECVWVIYACVLAEVIEDWSNVRIIYKIGGKSIVYINGAKHMGSDETTTTSTNLNVSAPVM